MLGSPRSPSSTEEPSMCSRFTVLDDFCHSPVESEEAESTSQAYEHCWGNTLEKTVPPFMAPEHRNGSRWGLLVQPVSSQKGTLLFQTHVEPLFHADWKSVLFYVRGLFGNQCSYSLLFPSVLLASPFSIHKMRWLLFSRSLISNSLQANGL